MRNRGFSDIIKVYPKYHCSTPDTVHICNPVHIIVTQKMLSFLGEKSSLDCYDDTAEELQQVSSMVDNLKSMAADMGTEIDNQNLQLNGINSKGIGQPTTKRMSACMGSAASGTTPDLQFWIQQPLEKVCM